MKVYIDGALSLSKGEATISVFDHGLLYGDGVMEGLRVYDGCIFRLDQHIERLYRSAQGIRLKIPHTRDEFRDLVIDTVRENGERNAYIRIMVTRGVGDLGLSPSKCPKPTVIIIVDRIMIYPPELYEKGIEVITAATRRPPSVCLDPQVKSLNYLNNILAKIEGENAGFSEVVMLNTEGYVVEGSSDNLFIYRDGELITPDASLGALRGITRGAVLEIAAKLGIPTVTGVVTRYELYTADECFVTGTAAELAPVVKVDGRTIGNGQVGPITRRLTEAFRKTTNTDGVLVFEPSAVSSA
jgi:branched-chain amino acid aminotransferase